MKIRNKMAIALRMARKNLLVSVILFWIGLICFSLFGRGRNTETVGDG